MENEKKYGFVVVVQLCHGSDHGFGEEGGNVLPLTKGLTPNGVKLVEHFAPNDCVGCVLGVTVQGCLAPRFVIGRHYSTSLCFSRTEPNPDTLDDY